ncbi:MAG TPA: RNA polymerase sigma factor, partial [Gaiellaceae bacterium]|nr:RNA polymerase sigma factor [Gaiellaceae bacterium]
MSAKASELASTSTNGEAVSAKASELASTSTNGDGPSHDAEQFFREYAGGIYRYCVRRLGSPEEAEDALQVVYLNAWRAMKRGTIPRTPSAWLLTVAENVCHSKLRARQRRTSFERTCEPGELADLAPARAEAGDGVGELSSALAGLPENQRKALLLREWRGLSYDEIASELTVSHGAVEMLLFRARRAASKAFAAGRPEAGRRGAILGAGILLLPRDLISHIRSTITGASPAKVAAVVAATAAIPLAVITIPPSGQASKPASDG